MKSIEGFAEKLSDSFYLTFCAYAVQLRSCHGESQYATAGADTPNDVCRGDRVTNLDRYGHIGTLTHLLIRPVNTKVRTVFTR